MGRERPGGTDSAAGVAGEAIGLWLEVAASGGGGTATISMSTVLVSLGTVSYYRVPGVPHYDGRCKPASVCSGFRSSQSSSAIGISPHRNPRCCNLRRRRVSYSLGGASRIPFPTT
jgi:hypothetical protein